MQCPQCGGSLVRPGARCGQCHPAAAPPAADVAGPMLARANLLRMRARWEEAVDQCVEVLRADARNPTAHSLLGDIYQDQGRLEDARHWYQLALELNPNSEADRAKLARVEETLDARQQRAKWESMLEGRGQPVTTAIIVRESIQRVGALAGAGVCALILTLAALASVSDGRRPAMEDLAGSVPGFSRAPKATVISESRRERELKKLLSRQPSEGVGQVLSVEVNPASQTANLRVLIPRSSRAPISTEFLMREGYRLAKALHEADRRLVGVTVWVLGPILAPNGQPDTDLLLVGTLSEQNLVARPEAVDARVLADFYGETHGTLYLSPEIGRTPFPLSR